MYNMDYFRTIKNNTLLCQSYRFTLPIPYPNDIIDTRCNLRFTCQMTQLLYIKIVILKLHEYWITCVKHTHDNTIYLPYLFLGLVLCYNIKYMYNVYTLYYTPVSNDVSIKGLKGSFDVIFYDLEVGDWDVDLYFS